MTYVSLDLTSAFARVPRSIDIAVLRGEHLLFSQMNWPAPNVVTQRDGSQMLQSILQAAGIAEGEAILLALDGPQGLSEPGQTMRACERALGTNGHAPDQLPPPVEGGPVHMGGYLRSSLDLFGALADLPTLSLAGLDANEPMNANLFEIYPGADWTVLAGKRLDKKTTDMGRRVRREILEAAGLAFPKGLTLPTADQNDAAVGAYLLKCGHEDPTRVRLVGVTPRYDLTQLREGLILHANAAVAGFTRNVMPEGPDIDAKADEAPAIVEPSPAITSCDEWNADDGRPRLYFSDNAMVWGTRPENGWLVAGRNYDCQAVGMNGIVNFALTFAPTVSAPAWCVAPSIQSLLRQLGLTPPPHLRNGTGISVPIVLGPIDEA